MTHPTYSPPTAGDGGHHRMRSFTARRFTTSGGKTPAASATFTHTEGCVVPTFPV